VDNGDGTVTDQWYVLFYDGFVSFDDKDHNLYVRAVRTGL
jgi:hypothetical protein